MPRPHARHPTIARRVAAAATLPLLVLLPLLPPAPAAADEGMWPPDMVPRQRIEQAHGIALADTWLDHVKRASVRFNVGGSGSFVSPRGLVLTNHHVAGDCIAKLATPAHDYLAAGYVAGVDGPEARCPDLEVDNLVSIQDVTGRVREARKPGMSDADGNRAMKGEMGAIEKECHDETQLRCDVVTLYAGAMYHLYRYRRYTDVRLVFAPEFATAFFGGDPDNFTFPRFDFDLAIFRVYEGGRRPSRSRRPSGFVGTRTDPRRAPSSSRAGIRRAPAATRRWRSSRCSGTSSIRRPWSGWGAGGRVCVAGRRRGRRGPDKRARRSSGWRTRSRPSAATNRGLRDAALLRKKAAAEAALRAGVDHDPALKAKLEAPGTTRRGSRRPTRPRIRATRRSRPGSVVSSSVWRAPSSGFPPSARSRTTSACPSSARPRSKSCRCTRSRPPRCTRASRTPT